MENLTPKVLLVDDDEDILELLKYNLDKEGYEVMGISEPYLVIDTIQQFHPNVAIMDIMMPGLNGFELCKAIRSLEFGRDLTIFFMTSGSESLSESAIKFGGDDFIQKLSGMRTLINKVNLVLKRKFIIRKRDAQVELGHWQLIKKDKTVISDSRKIKLSDLEFELLYFLAQNPGRSIPIKYLYNVVEINKVNLAKFSLIKYLKHLQEKFDRGLIEFIGEYRVRLNSKATH